MKTIRTIFIELFAAFFASLIAASIAFIILASTEADIGWAIMSFFSTLGMSTIYVLTFSLPTKIFLARRDQLTLRSMALMGFITGSLGSILMAILLRGLVWSKPFSEIILAVEFGIFAMITSSAYFFITKNLNSKLKPKKD